MMIKEIKISGLLSFGPEGVALPLKDLNVLIGPNGSGKSNLLEMLALLKAAPKNLSGPIKEMGGLREWLWRGEGAKREATLKVAVSAESGKAEDKRELRHTLTITEEGNRFELMLEEIEDASTDSTVTGLGAYSFSDGVALLRRWSEPARTGAGENSPRRISPVAIQGSRTISSSDALAGEVCGHKTFPELVIWTPGSLAP